jgi:hypothetical protein
MVITSGAMTKVCFGGRYCQSSTKVRLEDQAAVSTTTSSPARPHIDTDVQAKK